MRHLTAMKVIQLMVPQSASGLVQHAKQSNLQQTCREREFLKSVEELQPVHNKLHMACQAYLGHTWNSNHSLETDIVINSNWDISAGLGKAWVNATLEQCFLMELEPHMLYSGAHLCPVPIEKSPGRKHFNTAKRGGRESKTQQALVCQPATNIHPNCSTIVLNQLLCSN